MYSGATKSTSPSLRYLCANRASNRKKFQKRNTVDKNGRLTFAFRTGSKSGATFEPTPAERGGGGKSKHRLVASQTAGSANNPKVSFKKGDD